EEHRDRGHATVVEAQDDDREEKPRDPDDEEEPPEAGRLAESTLQVDVVHRVTISKRPTAGGGSRTYARAVSVRWRSRADALAAQTAAARQHATRLPGATLVGEVLERERRLGGALIEAGVAVPLFLWLAPLRPLVA